MAAKKYYILPTSFKKREGKRIKTIYISFEDIVKFYDLDERFCCVYDKQTFDPKVHVMKTIVWQQLPEIMPDEFRASKEVNEHDPHGPY